jgi:hypothetical protein
VVVKRRCVWRASCGDNVSAHGGRWGDVGWSSVDISTGAKGAEEGHGVDAMWLLRGANECCWVGSHVGAERRCSCSDSLLKW